MPRRRLLAALSSALIAMLVASTPASAAQQELVLTEEDVTEKRVYSPYAGRAYADQVFFGDMHFHTNLSFDAGLIGTTLDAHDGFRMARGEKVISNTGQPVQLLRPLDFLVDHRPRRDDRTGACDPGVEPGSAGRTLGQMDS